MTRSTREHDLVGRTALATMWSVWALYVVALLLHGPDYERLVDGWLGVLTLALPTAVCWSAWRKAGRRRAEVTCMALGMTAFVAGNISYVVSASSDGQQPFPSPADAGFLTFYPLALAALVLAVRRDLRGVRRTAWIDGVLGALGALAVLLAFLPAGFVSLDQGSIARLVVATAYPMFDLLLMAIVIGLLALQGFQVCLGWSPLLVGLTLFAVTDTLFAFRLAHDSYVVGTVLDALWPLAMALVAVWTKVPQQRTVLAIGPASLVVPGLSTVAAVVVLLWAARGDVSAVAVVFAALTIAATAAKMYVAFGQLWRTADLRHQANTDELTGLPNRRAFSAVVTADLVGPPSPKALLLLDLDGFKDVNDSLGRRTGDQVLVEIGWRLRRAVGASGFLARLGGDEFAVLIGEAQRHDALVAAARVQSSLVDPINVDGVDVTVRASIGVALYPDHGQDLDHLLSAADHAMDRAKALHEECRVHAPGDGAVGQDHFRTVAELRTGLRGEQFTLHYQPKIDVRTRQVSGVEALVRWRHPTRGLLQPSSFLSLTQQSGLMPALTSQVLAMAVAQAATWHRQGRPLTIAVNLTALSLSDGQLPARVADLLATAGIPPSALQVEITEESVMSDREHCGSVLSALRDLGVQIAIDDFGTGYSSLAYLKDLPVDELKLDRSFVTCMAVDGRAAALVAATIALAHSLELRMVAEGVETTAVYDQLDRLGCDEAQGHLISRPLPVPQLERWLAGHDPSLPLAGRLEALG